MDLPSLVQHLDEFPETALASLHLLRGLKSPEYGVYVGFIEGGKECLGTRISLQGLLEVRWHGARSMRIVGPLPSTVLSGGLDRGEAGSSHLARLDECVDSLYVPLGPKAF